MINYEQHFFTLINSFLDLKRENAALREDNATLQERLAFFRREGAEWDSDPFDDVDVTEIEIVGWPDLNFTQEQQS